MDPLPESIARDGDSAITITWNDGRTTRWTATDLRRACPCATCREKHRSGGVSEAAKPKPVALPVLSAAEARPLTIEAMRPVGSYAYNISFSDGHSSGLFPLSMLYDQAEAS